MLTEISIMHLQSLDIMRYFGDLAAIETVQDVPTYIKETISDTANKLKALGKIKKFKFPEPSCMASGPSPIKSGEALLLFVLDDAKSLAEKINQLKQQKTNDKQI